MRLDESFLLQLTSPFFRALYPRRAEPIHPLCASSLSLAAARRAGSARADKRLLARVKGPAQCLSR